MLSWVFPAWCFVEDMKKRQKGAKASPRRSTKARRRNVEEEARKGGSFLLVKLWFSKGNGDPLFQGNPGEILFHLARFHLISEMTIFLFCIPNKR